MLKIGFAEAEITPPLGTRIVGHFNEIRAEKINDSLMARAMAVDGEQAFIFVTCDLLSVRRSTVMQARQRIEEATGLPGDHISVSATHTHTGPLANRMFGASPDPAYLETLVGGIATAAIEAYQKRVPGTLTAAYGFEGRFSHQRRFMMRDGNARMHPAPGSTDVLYQEGPSDPELAVLWGEDESGKPLGCWVNYACHVNVAQIGPTISADYPGFMAAALKRHQDEQFVSLFGNGTCGNLCQVDVYDQSRNQWGLEYSQQMGEALGERVLEVVATGEKLDEPILEHRGSVIPLPIRHVPEELVQWAEAMQANAEALFVERCYAGMTLELMEQQRLEPLAPAEINAFRLGDFALVTLPGEIFVEFGLDIKLKSPAKRTWIVELANGVVGYVPTKKAFDGGGYEQRTATSSKLDPIAGEMMVATARALLESMWR
jgi:neutral ceramidase